MNEKVLNFLLEKGFSDKMAATYADDDKACEFIEEEMESDLMEEITPAILDMLIYG